MNTVQQEYVRFEAAGAACLSQEIANLVGGHLPTETTKRKQHAGAYSRP
jgi:hypothetical protein